MHEHEIYLKHCFELAKFGETLAFPNPIVGCVIVHEGKIIGEGFHRCCGEAHAEVNAINNAVNGQRSTVNGIKEDFAESTIYISLEPCAHHGKTPPCADLIIKHKFKRLVFSSYDPNPLVLGQGIKRIRAAGVEVIEPKDLNPELVEESNFINRVFFKIINTVDRSPLTVHRSWLTLKIAASAEGSMISAEKWITNSESRKDVHRLRSTHQLLVTSMATVRSDNPLYTVRHSTEELELTDIRNPDIVILKSNSDFTDAERNSLNIFQDKSRKILEYKTDKDNPKSLDKFIQDMVSQGYQKIMIEAGPILSEAFIRSGLIDEITYYLVANNILSNIIPQAPFLNEEFSLSNSEVLDGIDEEASNIKLLYNKQK
jgi:diaminohydroxyphosphoribosylaminopyrimidine deaminase/5-amino-6-(5-phosphoribosylamino)uracil reductase